MYRLSQILISVLLLAATPALAGQIDISLPVANPASDPAGIIGNIYQFSLMMGGLLAFGAIVYGGIKYTISAGNPGGQSDGKEWVKQALLGLLLLVGAVLVLRTINPNLIQLRIPPPVMER